MTAKYIAELPKKGIQKFVPHGPVSIHGVGKESWALPIGQCMTQVCHVESCCSLLMQRATSATRKLPWFTLASFHVVGMSNMCKEELEEVN